MSKSETLIVLVGAVAVLLLLNSSQKAQSAIYGYLGPKKLPEPEQGIGFYDMSLGWTENPAQTRIEV
jgi:hypothetical protein